MGGSHDDGEVVYHRESPLKIFVVYSAADKRHFQKFRAAAGTLVNAGMISIWSEDDIRPGATSKEVIATELKKADTVLALVSADFLSETRCSNLLQTAEMMGKRVTWVKLRPSLAEYNQVLSKSKPILSKPIDSYPNADDAWQMFFMGEDSPNQGLMGLLRQR